MNLYDFFDSEKALLNYAANISFATKELISKYSKEKYYFGSKFIESNLALFFRLGKEYKKQGFNIDEMKIGDSTIYVKEHVVDSKPFCKLIEFKRLSDNQTLIKKLSKQPKVLIVAPLSGHFATLLKDTVVTMLQDHNVYITDWEDAKEVSVEHGQFGLDTYIFYIQDFIRKFENINLVSVCQPTVPCLAAISLMAENNEKLPTSVTLMAGPIDARKSPTEVNKLATSKDINWFKKNLIYKVPSTYKGAGRFVYPGFLQLSAFVSMNYKKHLDSHISYLFDYWRSDIEKIKKHEDFYDEYNAVLDMDSKYYLQTVEEVFQKFSLAKGELKINGRIVDPSFIMNTKLLTVEGSNDDITGIGQTEAAHNLCKNLTSKEHHLIEGVGHYGVFSGKKWRTEIYPIVKNFISKNI